MEGQINAALRFLNESTSGGILSLTDDVMKQLKEKHPDPCTVSQTWFYFIRTNRGRDA